MPIIVKKTQDNSKTLASAAAAAAAAPSSPDNGEMRGTKDERSRPSWNRRIQPSRPSGDIRRTVLKDKGREKSSDSSSSSSSSTSSGSSSSSSSSNSSDDEDDDDDEKQEGRGQTDKSPPGGGGRTKNLAGFFAKQTDDVKTIRRKRLEVSDAPGTLVLENEPQRLEGVVRADDPGEWDKPIEIEKGRAKLIASMLQAKKKDDETKVPRKPFRLVVERGDPVVLENEPVVLEGVARSGEPHQADEEIFQERGRIRNIAERWKRQQQQQLREDSDEDVPEKPKKPAWLVELESAKESGVYETESTPIVRDDVVRAEDDEPDVISFQRTRNLRKMWSQIEQEKLQQDKEQEKSKTATQTQKQTSINSETDSDEDEEEEEETSSEEEEEEEQKKVPGHFQSRRDFRPGGSRKEDLAVRVPKKEERRTRKDSSSSASGNSRSSSADDSSSATKYRPTLYVNEASLKYLPKK